MVEFINVIGTTARCESFGSIKNGYNKRNGYNIRNLTSDYLQFYCYKIYACVYENTLSSILKIEKISVNIVSTVCKCVC